MLTAILIFLAISLAVFFAAGFADARRRRKLERRMQAGDAELFEEPEAARPKSEGGVFTALDAAIKKFSATAMLRRALRRANLTIKVSEFIVIVFLCASFVPLLVLLFFNSKPLAIICSAAGAALPFFYLRHRQAARKKMFEAQMLDAVTLISNSLKSGYSFLQSIDLITRELPPPVCEEFAKMLQEIKLGMAFEQSVKNLVERVDNADIDLVMTSVIIQREVGGNLSEILDKIAVTIRERVRIKGQVRTLTAQGRLSGVILVLLPVILAVVMYLISPDYIGILFKESVGRMMLSAAAVSEVLGMLIIRKIVDIKV
jgi:tight adherence protein B